MEALGEEAKTKVVKLMRPVVAPQWHAFAIRAIAAKGGGAMAQPVAAALPPAIKQGATAHLAAMMSSPGPAPAAAAPAPAEKLAVLGAQELADTRAHGCEAHGGRGGG